MINKTITKTDATKKEYLNRSRQLINKAKVDFKITEHEIDPRQLVVWLDEYQKNINPKTWRQYKSAILFYLELLNTEEAIEAIDYLKPIGPNNCNRDTNKTSSMKLKKISNDDWKKLEDYFLENKKYKWHEELYHWLKSSIITGLRPVEWLNVKLSKVDNVESLIVHNAKTTNGRSHGETRTIKLTNVSNDDLNSLKTHLLNIKTFSTMGEYKYFYNGCALALYKICRKIWPRRKKHITLYSARHQFSANAKNSGSTKNEIAALMGHAVDITATIHYGKKQAGNDVLKVEPVEEEVNKIRHIETFDFGKEKDKFRKIFDD